MLSGVGSSPTWRKVFRLHEYLYHRFIQEDLSILAEL